MSFSRDKIHPLTFFVKHPQPGSAGCRCLTGQVCCPTSCQPEAKAHTLTWRRARATQRTETQNGQNLHTSRTDSANPPICTFTSVTPAGYHISTTLLRRLLLCRGQQEKSKISRPVPRRGRNLRAHSYRCAAPPTAGGRLLCWVPQHTYVSNLRMCAGLFPVALVPAHQEHALLGA